MRVSCLCGEVKCTWAEWEESGGWIDWCVGWAILHQLSSCDVLLDPKDNPDPFDVWLPLDDVSLQMLITLY